MFMDVEKEDMKLVGVTEEDAENRVRWRQIIQWVAPTEGNIRKERRSMFYSTSQQNTVFI